MIIDKYVRGYINEDKDDHRWMKRLKREEVLDLLNDLRPRPRLWPELRLNQLVAIYLGIAYGFEAEDQGGGFSFWMDMGSGKTLVTLELMKYWHMTGEMQRGLVFVLSDKAYPTWERQIARFEIGLPYVSLEGPSAEKWRELKRRDSGLILCHYPGAVAMCTEKVTVPGKDDKPDKNKMALVPERIHDLMKGVDLLVLDESTRAGHPTSVTHRLCDYIAGNVKTRYALAGLPFGRDPTILFHQQRIIDGGSSFGPHIGMFREAFFTKEQNKWAKSRFAFIYTFDKRKTSDLSRRMQHRSITYEEHECLDIPKFVDDIIPIRLRGEARAYYDRCRDEIKQLAKAGGGSMTATKNVFLRMRQITSGFLGFTNDETGEKAKVKFTENPKLEILIEKLDGLPKGRKAVVFYEYTWSGQQIVAELSFIKNIKSVWIWSGTKNMRQEFDRFLNDPEYTVMVINNRIGAFSLDGLQEVANYLFVYESPVSVIDRKQLEKRIKRPGQKRKVFQFDIVCSGTVDETILEFHAEGTNLMKAVRKDPKVLL